MSRPGGLETIPNAVRVADIDRHKQTAEFTGQLCALIGVEVEHRNARPPCRQAPHDGLTEP